MKTSYFKKNQILFFLLATTLFFNNGCDFVAGKLGVDKVKVPTETFASNIPIVSGIPKIVKSNVNLGDVTLPDVFDVSSIEFNKNELVFTPSEPLNKTAASGKIEVITVLGDYVLSMVTIKIVDNAVAEITPNPVSMGSFTVATVQAMLNALPASDRPTLATDWNTLSAAALTKKINDLIKTLNFPFAMIMRAEVSGTLTIKSVQMNLDF